MVRAVLGHVGEVLCDWLECLVFARSGDEIEFTLMDAVQVDLLVVEACRADELVRGEGVSSLLSQAVIGGEVAVLSKPA